MFLAKEEALLSGRPWPEPCPHTSLSASASKAWKAELSHVGQVWPEHQVPPGSSQPSSFGTAGAASPAQEGEGGGGIGEEEGSGLSPLLCCCCCLRPNSREPHQGLGAPTCLTGPAGCHPLLPALLRESPWRGLRPAPERGCDSAPEHGLSSESSPLAAQLVSTSHPALRIPGSRRWTKCTGSRPRSLWLSRPHTPPSCGQHFP